MNNLWLHAHLILTVPRFKVRDFETMADRRLYWYSDLK